MTEYLEGEWDSNTRSFLTLEEKDDRNIFAHLIDTVTAEREIFISEQHKLAMAVEGDDVDSVNTRLTKGDDPPPAAKSSMLNSDEASTLTGDTRESKAKAYADKATKEVSLQYVNTIQQMNDNHEQEVANLERKLAAAMGKLGSDEIMSEQTEEDSQSVEVIRVREVNEDDNSDSDLSEEVEEYGEGKEDDGDMEDLSKESLDPDNFLIMESIRIRKEAREKQLSKYKQSRNSPFCKGKDDKTSYESERKPSKQKHEVSKVSPPKLNRNSIKSGSTPFAKVCRGDKL